jgi:hypothetical protein
MSAGFVSLKKTREQKLRDVTWWSTRFLVEYNIDWRVQLVKQVAQISLRAPNTPTNRSFASARF